LHSYFPTMSGTSTPKPTAARSPLTMILRWMADNEAIAEAPARRPQRLSGDEDEDDKVNAAPPPAAANDDADGLAAKLDTLQLDAMDSGGGDAKPGGVFVVFDFETHKGKCATQQIRIVQVGAVALDADMREVSRFSTLVNPGVRMTAAAMSVHGLTDDTVKDAPTWATAGAAFTKWISGLRQESADTITLLAHNGKAFDARILVHEHERHQIAFPEGLRFADTIAVFRKLYPGLGSYALGKLYEGVLDRGPLEGAHDADADVGAVKALLCAGKDRDGAKKAILECSEEFPKVVQERIAAAGKK